MPGFTGWTINRPNCAYLARWTLLVLLFNLGLLAVLLFRPPQMAAIDDLAQCVGPILTLPLCGIGFNLWRRGQRAGRFDPVPLAIGLSAAAFSIGQIIWAWYELVLAQDVPFPSLADVAFMMSYPCLLLAVVALPQRQFSAATRVRVVLDGAMVLTALVTLSWYFVLGPTVMESGESPLARTIGSIYPAWDVAILASVVVLLPVLGRGNRMLAGFTIAVGLTATVAADTLFDLHTLSGSYATGDFGDVLWPLSYMVMALGAGILRRPVVRESRARGRGSVRNGPRGTRIWLAIIPYALIPPVAGLFVYVNHFGDDPAMRPGVEIGAACLLALVLLRQVLAVAENTRLSNRLRSRNEELRDANRRLQEMATTDAHTGLPNHRAIVNVLGSELERAYRYNRPCSLLFIDIDHFKTVNDGLGHSAGDAVLGQVARVMRQQLRGIDTLGRWGGEEFVVVLPETDAGEALDTGERLRGAVAGHLFAVGGDLHITCSIGVSSYPVDTRDADVLVDRADQAMYCAKRLGRNQVRGASDAALELVGIADPGEMRDGHGMIGVVEALSALVDARDQYTAAHSNEVARIALRIALAMGLDTNAAHDVGLAARLHDVGKIAVPDAVLRKPGRLTPREWDLVRTHPAVGADVVARMPALRHLARVIRAHHEWWDGRGYPDSVSGEGIPLAARIISVADAFAAMITDRPYRSGISESAALEELQRHAGTQFDPDVVTAMQRVMLVPLVEDRLQAG